MLSPLLEAIAQESISLAQKIETAPEIPSYEKLLIEKAGYGRLMARRSSSFFGTVRRAMNLRVGRSSGGSHVTPFGTEKRHDG
jgi:hypothetical protein